MDPLLVKTQCLHFCGLSKKIKMLPSLVSLKTKCKTQLFDMAFLKYIANGCSPKAYLHLSQSPLFHNLQVLGIRSLNPKLYPGISTHSLGHAKPPITPKNKLSGYTERKS